jgi:hypothetical protein
MKDKHGWAAGDKALRRNHNYPDEPQKWIEFTFNETYLKLANEFPEDYRTLDGNGWKESEIKCDVCGYDWTALHVTGAKMLQCPNCKQMSYC